MPTVYSDIWDHLTVCKQMSFGLFKNVSYKLLVYRSYTLGGARGVMVIVVGNGHGDTSSNLDETDCISHSTNTLGKGMNPIILPPAMGK